MRIGPRLLERSFQFLVIKGEQDLPGPDRIALANENLLNAPANLRANANVARLDGSGAQEGGVPVEPIRVESGGRRHGRHPKNDEDALPFHKTKLLE